MLVYPQENIYILLLLCFRQSCSACDCDEIFELNEAIKLEFWDIEMCILDSSHGSNQQYENRLNIVHF